MSLPYVELSPIDLSSVGLGELDWFALFVLAGLVVAVTVYDRMCSRGGAVSAPVARAFPEACVVGGFVVAHLVHVLVYHPELLARDPWLPLKIWAGMSSMGGFAGGLIAGAAYVRWRRQPLLPYADRIVVAIAIGWVFGRLGCATSHDHPGSLTDFPLAVAYPGGARHDLGLYELAFTLFVLVPLLLRLSRRPWRTGTLVGAALLAYAPVRFFLDFLRARDLSFVDPRYLGLTPAQYAAVAMFGAGCFIFVRRRQGALGGGLQPPLWGKAAVAAVIGSPVLVAPKDEEAHDGAER